ncbi:endocytosis defective- protein [Yamadazyma tenuis]|uniref:Actin cytoskeleton-regulatory complex protein END3 n=1 Tax=Candida tenuis (strain ATCC 10573 / BCRC 21748 / CBS 615 / JCM 9827 / NBRC 10315 / NRRL Y-1498 / VKM Y-70) TaxID=590646 RepID=G3BBX1_CANTC|nr:uncharacterized protein CANTEDRAFT_116119 [Yamadazyma tenuis ATCC 10573]XP_006690224.1 uncharacterized protein CANTEDRAFT_116119 [Yamadazyma tenuis ATCC 10573]EGV61009.1 hypothetical protein CANTEDRAFT_116119 [Yamadazyma tenuis ATCC 10573]EGV61010.1 hypothetical protein CANTEDRAFT_116119 [Yamadazyma tenuis ATCC 10573]WEJ94665.1 endocytosis defective- protein [Yamadazyma tenuis]
MPRLEEWEIKKYWEIFQGLNPIDNKLDGTRVSPILKNSRLSDDKLSKIWDLSDIDSDGKLDFEEFCITMRLIYDLVNNNQGSIPEELPGWLTPASKSHLIQANRAVNTGDNNFSSNNSSSNDTEGDEEFLSDDFDWYISPTDRSSYEAIYNSNSDNYGRVRFESLEGLYSSLSKVPRTDISSAWNLVNPKSFETIDKDQVLVFLHILNQREHGKRIPRGVPVSLRATFSKEQPNYDLNAVSITRPQRSNVSSNGPKGFATDYLSKIGQSNVVKDSGTDFSATEGTDWEEVRLRRELANLEDLLERANRETKTDEGVSDELTIVKHEFELLLNYKEEKLQSLQTGKVNSADLTDVRNDIELIESQVNLLQGVLKEKEAELTSLQNQLQV